MQGVVHVIDAVLKPPPDALARAVVYQALQDFGVKGSMTPARRLGPRCRGDGIPRARLRLLVGEKAYREEGPEAGQGAVASQVPPWFQALPWHQPASQHVIRDDVAHPQRDPEAGQGAVASQVPSCPQAPLWHRPATQHVIRDNVARPGRGCKACPQPLAGDGMHQLG